MFSEGLPMRDRWKFLLLIPALAFIGMAPASPGSIAQRIIDPRTEAITMHWKNDGDHVYGNIGSLRSTVEQQRKKLLFAMNGGMYTMDHAPVGLYVEQGETLKPIDRRTEGYGNFFMQPNGVFGTTEEQRAFVVRTDAFKPAKSIQFATQSGPMLVADGTINAQFRQGSKNVQIRNGVGVLPDGRVLFAISREPVNFHDFARFFLERGCTNALYLDGAVSKAYIPEGHMANMDGDLGVLIAVIGSE